MAATTAGLVHDHYCSWLPYAVHCLCLTAVGWSCIQIGKKAAFCLLSCLLLAAARCTAAGTATAVVKLQTPNAVLQCGAVLRQVTLLPTDCC